VTGDPVVLIGYPTGIEGILARAGSDTSRNWRKTPEVTQMFRNWQSKSDTSNDYTGHIGDVLKTRLFTMQRQPQEVPADRSSIGMARSLV